MGASISALDTAAGRIRCVTCGHGMLAASDSLVCPACSTVYSVNHGLVETAINTEGKYGGWYKTGSETYEADFNLTDAYGRWVVSRIARLLTTHVDLPADFVVELACGTGVHTRSLRSQAIAQWVLGVDISIEMLSQAARRYDPHTLYMVDDVHQLHLQDESADVVIGICALHHFLDVQKCLAEVRRILRPGGISVFMEPFYVGTQMLVFALQALFSTCKASGVYDSDDMNMLEATLNSYAANIETRHRFRDDRSRLAALDDKHLFTAQQVQQLSVQAGFSGVECRSVYEGYEGDRTLVFRDIATDIMRLLQREAGVADLELDFKDAPMLASLSELYGEYLLDRFSPQQFIVFTR